MYFFYQFSTMYEEIKMSDSIHILNIHVDTKNLELNNIELSLN